MEDAEDNASQKRPLKQQQQQQHEEDDEEKQGQSAAADDDFERLKETPLVKEWIAEQNHLRSKLIETDELDGWNGDTLEGLERIGGVDISFFKESETDAVAALIVLHYPSFRVLYEKCVPISLTLPYICNFLAFRESPHLELLLQELKETRPDLMPQVLVVDGNGTLHPRRFGLACHLGVRTNMCTIGVGKNLLHVDGLAADQVRDEAEQRLIKAGDWMELAGPKLGVVGAAVRSTNETIRPIYVSIGHKISLATAVRLVSTCCPFRIPEPVRQADQRSRTMVRNILAQATKKLKK